MITTTMRLPVHPTILKSRLHFTSRQFLWLVKSDDSSPNSMANAVKVIDPTSQWPMCGCWTCPFRSGVNRYPCHNRGTYCKGFMYRGVIVPIFRAAKASNSKLWPCTASANIWHLWIPHEVFDCLLNMGGSVRFVWGWPIYWSVSHQHFYLMITLYESFP